MQTRTHEAAAVAALPLPAAAGYVEAVTSDRVLGWAWDPRSPSGRIAVELRLDGKAVSEAVADQPRPDLAASGIGDGAHAFGLVIPEALRARAGDMRVFARPEGAEAVAIGMPPAAEAVDSQMIQIQRGLEGLMRSQRVLHRHLEAIQSGQPDKAAICQIAEVQAKLVEEFGALERFVVRLDEMLLALTPQRRPGGRAAPPAAILSLALSGLALAVGICGLVASLGR